MLEKLDGADEMKRLNSVEDMDIESIRSITEDMFAAETALYVEMLDDNYHTVRHYWIWSCE